MISVHAVVVQGCFELSRKRIDRLIDDLHRPLLQLTRHQQRPYTRPTAAAAGGDDDNDEDVSGDDQLKHFDDAVFSFLRQGAAQRLFSPCVEVCSFVDSV